MKKFIKAMLIAACVFTAVGIGLSVGGVAMGATVDGVEIVQQMRHGVQNFKERFWEHRDWDDDDWDDDWDDDDDDWDDDWDDEDWDEDRSTTSGSGSENKIYRSETVKKLEVDLKYDEFVMEAYEGDTINVEVENDSVGNVRVKTESNTLKIESINKRKNDRTVTVHYPADMKFTKVEIDVEAGSVEFMDKLEADELEVNVGAGQFTNSDTLIARKAEFEVGTGQIDVMRLTADKISSECGIGEIIMEVSGKEKDYNYKLECGIGTISIEDDSFSSIVGEKKIKNSGAAKSMDLECGMGTIDVAFTDGE